MFTHFLLVNVIIMPLFFVACVEVGLKPVMNFRTFEASTWIYVALRPGLSPFYA